MLDSIYHMTLKILGNCIFGVKTSRVTLILRNFIMDVITFPVNLQTTSGLSILLHGVIHSQMQGHVIICFILLVYRLY